MSTPALPLRIRQLVKDFDSLRAVDHVSFDIFEGEIFGLLGPNGAGKTTIISVLTTLERPTSGDIKVFGHDVARESHITKTLLGAVPQETYTHGFFNLEEIMEFHSGYYGIVRNQEWTRYLLHRLGLWEHRHKKVRELSGGMKKRLLTAKALVHRPKLLLLDEPTAGVDIELRASLLAFVEELKAEGTTILLTTHELREAEMLCDRVAIIQKGKIRTVGTICELIEQYTSREITLKLSAPQTVDSPYLLHQENSSATFRIPSTVNFPTLLDSAHIPPQNVQDVAVREGNLEDVMREILKEGAA